MSEYKIDVQQNKSSLERLIFEVSNLSNPTNNELYKLFKKNTSSDGDMFSKSDVIIAYRKLKRKKLFELTGDKEKNFYKNIKMKKIRTMSGVTPVTVLTKPFPCPGKCIFCPNDVRMPKSYLSDEPGAQRAESNKFDPYLQTFNRLVAFRNTGHPTDKVELLILGGTWSSYPESYQIWFVKRCFDAMHDFSQSDTSEMLDPKTVEYPFEENKLSEINGENMQLTYNQVIAKATLQLRKNHEESATWEELFKVHKQNETSPTRCVGLVIETRPDEINEKEVIRIRKLGATKVQIGIQSLNDKVLSLNKRGHDVNQTKRAMYLLRCAGFKILAHWMPNLYGSTPENDIKDFKKLFSDIAIRPDELKIYPCSLVKSAELMRYYNDGLWQPYTEEELLHVAVNIMPETPRYCRLTRVIRDIPSIDIVTGNKKTNFRQIAEQEIAKKDKKLKDIRSREIKTKTAEIEQLELKITKYKTAGSEEYFIEYITKNDLIAGFLRLSIPNTDGLKAQFMPELEDMPIIREIHVYGQSVEIGKNDSLNVQHKGLGKNLINEAKKISKQMGYSKIAVISSVGTREYYKKSGFTMKGLYQVSNL